MESSMNCKMSSRHDHEGLNGPRRKASKYIIGEGGDTEARIVSPE
jgi:hypothetical protein